MKTPSFSRENLIVAYPEAGTHMGPLHRDDVAGPIYSVFLLITPVTKENGTVQIYLGSQKWKRYLNSASEDVLKNVEREIGVTPVPILLEGEQYDLVVFDGRLLHQSVYNYTKDTRITFAFSLFDASKFPNYVGLVF